MQITIAEYKAFKKQVSRSNAFFSRLGKRDPSILSVLLNHKDENTLINQRTCNWLVPIMIRNGFVKSN